MSVNRRVMILQKLMKEQNCTIKQLSLLCDTSYKTIQEDIKSINLEIKRQKLSIMITTQRGIGAVLESVDVDEITQLIDHFNKTTKQLLDYDKEYASLKIAYQLVQQDYLKIDDLCESMSLSRSAVNELLNTSKKLLHKWHITISSKPHYGLYAIGLESDIRNFLYENGVLKTASITHTLLGNDVAEFFTLREGVIATIRNFDVSINDTSLEQLLLYVEVMALRIKADKPLEEMACNGVQSSFEYILSEKILLLIESCVNKVVEKQENDWIYRFVIGKCLKKTDNNRTVDHEMIDELLPNALVMMKNRYGYEFMHDLDLYTSLSIHLNALMKRAQMNSYLINPMLDSIKTYSLLAYDMATDVSQLLNESLGVKLPDDEISYLAIHLHLAIERQKQTIIPRKALVICPTGKGMSEMIAHHVKKQFGEYISELKTCGYYELELIDYTQYDYIFTMRQLDIDVPLPVIAFSLHDDKHEIKKTKLQIMGKRDEGFILASLIPSSLFFGNLEADSKEDALKQMIHRVNQVVSLHDDFYNSVIRREDIVTTDLDNGFAIPHPLDKEMAEHSFFAVGILNNAIVWGKKKVRIILLTYIKGDMEVLDQFYNIFAELVTAKEYEISLLNNPTYEHFVEIVKRISEEVSSY